MLLYLTDICKTYVKTNYDYRDWAQENKMNERNVWLFFPENITFFLLWTVHFIIVMMNLHQLLHSPLNNELYKIAPT